MPHVNFNWVSSSTLGHIHFGKSVAHAFRQFLRHFINRFPWNLAQAIFKSYPNGGKKFAKLYWIFQKLDHLTCNKILELVQWV